MTNLQKVERYLEEQPLFRERRNKDRGIVNILLKDYSSLNRLVDEGMIHKEILIEFVQQYNSLDRYWRKTLELREDLRGKDYNEKYDLALNKMDELGYEVQPPKFAQPTLL
jgi:hypothetical protein